MLFLTQPSRALRKKRRTSMDGCVWGDLVLATPWQEGKEMAWGFRTVPSDPTLLPDVHLQTLKSEPHLSQPC